MFSRAELQRKTGTATIVGLVFQNGVILGADTNRATENVCAKIHYLAPNIYCCGASGTAAETMSSMVSSQLQLHRCRTGKESGVKTALNYLQKHIFSTIKHVSAAPLLVAGVDVTGPYLCTVYHDGSINETTLPFEALGSGSLAAMAILKSKYKMGLSRDEGVDLVKEAIYAGSICNDLGSAGRNNVDVCVITKA